MSDPQAVVDQRWCARFLLQNPLLSSEKKPEAFRLVRRHEQELDRWFTQRLGYRLHVSADTARLYKTAVVSDRRPLMTVSSQPRPFAQREYVVLCLLLAAVAAGPRVISLRDLIDRVRTAASDAELTLREDLGERRALVTAVKWLIELGVARELHERVDRYIVDEEADAVLEINPDRVTMLPLPSLTGAASARDVIDRSERRAASRQWMRARLVEDPVLYRSDLTEGEWGELRRRLGGEGDMLNEMFGLALEVRAEGVAAIDPSGDLSDRPLPTTGTVGHAALLLVEALTAEQADSPDAPMFPMERVIALVAELGTAHRSHWSKLAEEPAKLTRRVLDLLIDHRLVRIEDSTGWNDGGAGGGNSEEKRVELLPFAHRFAVLQPEGVEAEACQAELW